nr:T9SS type A sorting domain-containing protein [candidate division KSB1 bacterium]NIR72589.1 T9SS type A sorting domain-containing protein [candidate division KSB1 bacterium]NIS23649.1 T9SS type A sorting domain-containing protein [candidate division KSB1 bacterium]NIT70573.1 T9SS type A sorting domain-containing protein [candidate division KSB1 bacterium]NIU24291.1 T9SS type A sorting domain-containing protein [candidate division KSB1 bacterium]
HTPGVDFVERTEVIQGSGGAGAGLAAQDKEVTLASTGSVDGAFDDDVDWAVVGLEIKPPQALTKQAANSQSENDAKTYEPPAQYQLFQNYPNPFNAETTIEFTLPKANHVRLAIYNVKGQQVRKLIDKTMAAGHKRITWDGRNSRGEIVGSGLYFLRLKTNGQNFIRKIHLQK